MKKITLAILTILLMITACNQHDLITTPDNSDLISSENLNLVKLPQKAPNSLNKSISVGDYISKANGGQLSISDEFTTEDGKTVKIFADINFPGGYFESFTNSGASTNSNGDPYIIMTIDNETASITFSPAMTFNNQPSLYVGFEGLEVDEDRYYDFRFVSLSGNTEILNYTALETDEELGKLEVQNVLIPHFSRYGFLN